MSNQNLFADIDVSNPIRHFLLEYERNQLFQAIEFICKCFGYDVEEFSNDLIKLIDSEENDEY